MFELYAKEFHQKYDTKRIDKRQIIFKFQFGFKFQFYRYFLSLRITDEGSIPEMCVLPICLFYPI